MTKWQMCLWSTGFLELHTKNIFCRHGFSGWMKMTLKRCENNDESC